MGHWRRGPEIAHNSSTFPWRHFPSPYLKKLYRNMEFWALCSLTWKTLSFCTPISRGLSPISDDLWDLSWTTEWDLVMTHSSPYFLLKSFQDPFCLKWSALTWSLSICLMLVRHAESWAPPVGCESNCNKLSSCCCCCLPRDAAACLGLQLLAHECCCCWPVDHILSSKGLDLSVF